jgi:hypothetical protein
MYQFINITKYNRLLYSYQWKGPLKFSGKFYVRILFVTAFLAVSEWD